MRKVFLFMMVTLDGYFEGPNHDINWHNVDGEFHDFANQQLGTIDTLVFGRRTYDMMASWWPTPEGLAADPTTAKLMNETGKVVFSHQQGTTDWQNSHLVVDHATEEIKKLKAGPGSDIAIFGSNNLVTSLMPDNLVDEFRIMINPVALGKGSSLFTGLENPTKFNRTAIREFGNGNVLVTYRPA